MTSYTEKPSFEQILRPQLSMGRFYSAAEWSNAIEDASVLDTKFPGKKVGKAGIGENAIAGVKQSDQTIVNNTTLQNDSNLYFAIGANERWSFAFTIFYREPPPDQGTDFKFSLSTPAGSTIIYYLSGSSGKGISDRVVTTIDAILEVSPSLGGSEVCVFDGGVINGDTAGNVQFKWSQKNATSTVLTVYGGSYFMAQKYYT